MENNSMKINFTDLKIKFDKLNKNCLELESEWNFLLLTQNYYYLLMDIEWRMTYDWIHIRQRVCEEKMAINDGEKSKQEHNNLLLPIETIDTCSKKYIRTENSQSSNLLNDHNNGFAAKNYFENYLLPNLENMRRITPKSDLFKNVCIRKKN